MCGEQKPCFPYPHGLSGSSPRVRGTDLFQGYVQRDVRFIPACAGNSIIFLLWLMTRTVHPRVCGEQSWSTARVLLTDGSSPCVRGTVPGRIAPLNLGRFIPACAGNSSQALGLLLQISVHPRVCGEQLVPFREAEREAGSSPRVRGTDPSRKGDFIHSRFIPACAGNSRTGLSKHSKSTVHPRVCGEQFTSSGTSYRVDGSSPRVRGTV